MAAQARIYFDQAATSWPKPEEVYQAVDHFQRQVGAAPGRGSYASALESGRGVADARHQVARLLGVADDSHIVFTANCTGALNLALSGFLTPGSHVVTSEAEHNSILRPLVHLAETRGILVSYARCDAAGCISVDDLRSHLRPETTLVAVTHASNVTGALQPIEPILELAHQQGARLLVDAAQSAGHWPWNLAELPVDLLAAAGHKGLLGPLGTGFLYLAPGMEPLVDSLQQGGTGSASESERQPLALPQKYESGNLNAPGLWGLAAGVRFVAQRGLAAVRRHEMELTGRLLEELRGLPGLEIHGPADPQRQVGVVSLTTAAYDPQELSGLLDSMFGIEARAGLHCAPRMHRRLGTIDHGGTLRLSLGALNTAEQVATVGLVLRQLLVGSVAR